MSYASNHAARIDRRKYADKHNVCRECAEDPRAPGRVRCATCIAAKRVLQQQRRERLAAAGLCQECARAPRVMGRARCEACARANAARVNAWRVMA